MFAFQILIYVSAPFLAVPVAMYEKSPDCIPYVFQSVTGQWEQAQ